MAGIKALFNGKQLANVFEQFQNEVDDKILQTLQYAGEQFVNKARLSGNYRDRTGNLRSSIGYIILLDGKVIDENFEVSGKGYDGQTGLLKAKSFAQEIAAQYSKGYVLIGVAGMSYSAAVEAKGYDVITGSVDGASGLIKSIISELGEI